MEPIRLIVTDLDGTFLNTYHELNEENVRAVKAAQQNGIVVCAVTARNFDSARFVVIPSGFDPLMVTNNGASIVDIREESYKYTNFIDPKSVRAIIEAAVEAEASVDVYTKDFSVIYNKTARVPRGNHAELWLEKPEEFRQHLYRYDDLDEMIERIGNCAENITLHGKDYGELPGWLFRRIVEQGEFYLTSSHFMCIDIMAYGSTKWQGVQRLAGYLGVNRENVMALGDNSNDIGMIRWAGVGVAVGNAPDAVKRAADIVAAANTDNGFANVVYDLIKKQGKL
jgi:hypothetical protein